MVKKWRPAHMKATISVATSSFSKKLVEIGLIIAELLFCVKSDLDLHFQGQSMSHFYCHPQLNNFGEILVKIDCIITEISWFMWMVTLTKIIKGNLFSTWKRKTKLCGNPCRVALFLYNSSIAIIICNKMWKYWLSLISEIRNSFSFHYLEKVENEAMFLESMTMVIGRYAAEFGSSWNFFWLPITVGDIRRGEFI